MLQQLVSVQSEQQVAAFLQTERREPQGLEQAVAVFCTCLRMAALEKLGV